MKKEINKAVETFHRIALGTKNADKKNAIPQSKLSCFVTVLTELLYARYQPNWYPEDPERGSGYRCIRVNAQSIDPCIVKSLKRADIVLSKGLIRTELTIWVDPGVVSVRIGEDGSIGSEVVDEEVHRMRKTKEETKKRTGSESDEGFSSSRSSSPSNSETSDSPRAPRSSPPVSEYNPYSPPVHVSYPHRQQQQPSQPAPSRKSPSPVGHRFSPGPAPQGILMPSPGTVVVSTPNGDMYQVSQGQIPVPSQRAVYTRPRSLFPGQDMPHGPMGKMAVPYAMARGNFPQANFYDIPAMA